MADRTWSSGRCLICSGKVGRIRATSWAVMGGIRDMASVTLPGIVGPDPCGVISGDDECAAVVSWLDAAEAGG